MLDDFFATFPNAKDVKLGLNKKNKSSANNYQNSQNSNNKNNQTNGKSQWYKDENGKWRKKEDVNNNVNNENNFNNSSQNIQTQQQVSQQLNCNSKTSEQQVDNSIGIPNGSRRIIHPTPTPYSSTARSARCVSSPTYHGILSKSLTPSNSTTITITDITQLPQLKQDIKDVKYKDFDNVILKINDNELVIKTTN